MRNPRAIVLSIVGLVLAASLSWIGCGGDDHDDSNPTAATITGNVSSVNPVQASRPETRWFARMDSLLVSEAIAQGTCPATHTLICAANGRDSLPVCGRVDSTDCTFMIEIDTAGDFSRGAVAFVNDANDNGIADPGEPFAILTNNLVPLCNGTVVTLNDVFANFSALTATAVSVVKNPDTCAGTPTATTRPTSTPTRTPNGSQTPNGTTTPGGPSGTSTPTRTPTGTKTATPTMTGTTYVSATSIQEPPSTWLAFASGLGVVGLLLPRRRRRR